MEKKLINHFIDYIHKFVLQNIKPNVTFILKVSKNHQDLGLKKEKLKIDMIILNNLFIRKLKTRF